MSPFDDFASEYEPFEFDRCEHTTDEAVLLIVDGEEVCIPRSLIENHSHLDESTGAGTIFVKSWWLDQEGWL